MILLFDIFVAALHALAAWAGITTYRVFYTSLPFWEFRVWHFVLVVFYGTLVSLTYLKFFRRLSLAVLATTFVVTAAVVDLVFFTFLNSYSVALPIWDCVLSYSLLAAVVFISHKFMSKK